MSAGLQPSAGGQSSAVFDQDFNIMIGCMHLHSDRNSSTMRHTGKVVCPSL